ncbi:hypothetical protein N5K27_22395 [Pigmentiphaga sp. GD03639]|uniref:hypothetical protein n=1 Tax=Pigmentiphaga sp. GD03639 TaxID=2975354 RepID=UPI0024490235|nr:hypothetical protein [Pigmentiphaga sp. GD03639]MDH2239062.1 hypothetical protein [Pigmentiphaga sp. GD03639]
MAAVNFTDGLFQAQDDNGRPLIGGRLYTYQNGTTTPAVTYTDQAGTQPNTNPVILDARGEATVFLLPDQLYTFVLKDRNDALIWSMDGVSGITSSVEFGQFKTDLAGPDGGNLVGLQRPGPGSVTRDAKSYFLSQSPQPQDKGGKPEAGFDNTAALDALYAGMPDAVDYPAGTYEVTGNFPRLNIPHTGPGAWKIIDGVDSQTVYVDSNETHGPATVYVDPVNGSDTDNHGLSRSYPFKTLQRAFDSLPLNINHQQTIVQMGGVCNTSSRAAASMPRPAILYTQGKNISPRTDSSGGNVRGMVVFKGESSAILETNPVAGYPYGIYGATREIGVQDLEIRPAASGITQALVTANRNAYFFLQGVNVNSAAGAAAALGVVCESGGFAEIINSTLAGATGYDLVVYAGSGASVARPGGVGTLGKALVSGDCDIAVGGRLTGNSLVGAGGRLSLTGKTSARVLVSGDINVDPGGVISGVYADITGNIVGRGTDMRLSSCGWSKTITALGGTLRLDASKSYVAPATMSEVASPLVVRDGAEVVPDPSTEIRNNANVLVSQDYGRQVVAPNANGYVIPITLEEKVTTMTLNAAGANRTGCTLGAVQGIFPGSRAPDGAVLIVGCAAGGSFSTQIIEGSTAIIPGGGITIGVSSTNYSGATFQYASDVDRWRLVGVGLQFP